MYAYDKEYRLQIYGEYYYTPRKVCTGHQVRDTWQVDYYREP